MQYQKAKSVSKEILSRGPKLRALILKTMKTCSDVVGSTLGPGGMSVVIERQEERLPPMITKDGVTVFRNLGFDDSAQHVLMEAARDASVRTAAEAGDGTTTATILAEALVRRTMEFCDANPKVSPQRVVRTLERGFRDVVEPWIREHVLKTGLGTPGGRSRLHAVAKVSANGDVPLADAVLKCFDLTGDEGNVTIIEASGPSGYEVERIEGYPVFKGYEDCCGKFYQSFINDPGRQMVSLDRPTYVLIHGRLNDIYSLLPIFEKIDSAAQAGQLSPNVVLVATGFSEVVMAHLAANFRVSNSINVYPLVAPMNQMQTGQYDFLRDVAALSGATIFDPMNAPVDNATLDQLGTTTSFEAGRFRSTILGYREELLVLERVEELKTLLKTDLSDLDRNLIQERIGKISGGIAKLKVVGASSGELREKRDRAEDAICAVRGALKHGALPGGAWALLNLREYILCLESFNEVLKFTETELKILKDVLATSFEEPAKRLFTNAGYHEDELPDIFLSIATPLGASVDYDCAVGQEEHKSVFDVLEGKLVDTFEGGILDSTPAVLEAIRNSISIAALLGTCGGTVVFKRDLGVERQEARDTAEFLRNANTNEADERP
jgi:chaperonin GroEL